MRNEEGARLQDWLDTKWKQHPCTVCDTNHWQIAMDIQELGLYRGSGFVQTGPADVFPAVLMSCTNCGNTLVINALISGVLRPDAPNGNPNTEETPPPGAVE